MDRFKKNHPKTPVISARNKEKDFEELSRLVGPPSRVMRWCCTVFKTGTIQKKIRSLYRDKKQILTFYGIRRSESVSRSKYERESDSPKITKQRIVSPIIDWMNFDMGNTRLGEVFVLDKRDQVVLMPGRIGTTNLRVTVLKTEIAGAKDLKTAEERIKCQLTKYQMCMGCLACESVCRLNALSIRESKDGEIQYYISDEKCKRCGECVNHFTAGCYMRKVLAIKRHRTGDKE